MTRIINKQAKFNYHLFETFEAGIVLNGGEVKAVRAGSVNLSNAHARIINDEVYLINAIISVPNKKDYDESRIRKLLMHKSEIISIKTKIKAKKLTLVPTKVYTKRHLVKVELALAKSRRSHSKKASLKKRDLDRDMERALRGDKGNDERA